MSIKDTLIEKLQNKSAEIAIIGLGYVGLPLAVVFGEAGFKVTGIDPNARKVDSLNKGVSYIPDVKTEAVAFRGNDLRVYNVTREVHDDSQEHIHASPAEVEGYPGCVG